MKSAVLAFTLCLFPCLAHAGERDLLWHVVQTCVAAHKLVGTPFPCLAVDLERGLERGTATVRAPFDTTHLVVAPTVPVSGIEAARLLAPGSPNYFADAWQARHFVAEALPHRPERGDYGLAINSRPGRSQDQLHIHVDCIRPDVKRSLARQLARLRSRSWTPIVVVARAPRYLATVLDESEFAQANIFALAQGGLDVPPDGMADVTIVVTATDLAGRPGFIVLARRRLHRSRDEAHGEALLDHSCHEFR